MLAIIPARAGSKGLPKKNIKLLNGIPLIEYTVKAAIKSKFITRIILSTDDEKAISICKKFKEVEIPFKRPKRLSNDKSIVTESFFHLFKWLQRKENAIPQHFCVLQPTSPLRLSKDIDGAIELFFKTKASSVLSVYETRPLAFNLSKKNRLISLSNHSSKKMLSRQDVKNMVIQNGAVHIFDTEILIKKKTYYTNKTYGYLMPAYRSVDIDDEFDFFIAEQIIKNRKYKK